jgi:hypothetical protein
MLHSTTTFFLGHSWTYAMTIVVSSVFQVICFPHEGKIMTIDQLSFSHSDSAAWSDLIVPLIDGSQMVTESIGIGMYSSLMGTFNIPTPISYISSTLIARAHQFTGSMSQVHHFQMTYFEDPWILPSPSDSIEGIKHAGMENPLSATEISYQAIQRATVDSDPTPLQTRRLMIFRHPFGWLTLLILLIVLRWYFPLMRLF